MTYKVLVRVMAEVEYETEVEASNEVIADAKAVAQWRNKLPEDFIVEKTYITQIDAIETQQTTWECEECDEEITESQYRYHDHLCAACWESLPVDGGERYCA